MNACMCCTGRDTDGKDHDIRCPAHPKTALDVLDEALVAFNHDDLPRSTTLALIDISLSLRCLVKSITDTKKTVEDKLDKLGTSTMIGGLGQMFAPFLSNILQKNKDPSTEIEEPEIEDAGALCICLHSRGYHSMGDGPCKEGACGCETFSYMTPKITPERAAEIIKEAHRPAEGGGFVNPAILAKLQAELSKKDK